MQTKPFTYLFTIQYLGLRYHGWQRQKGVKTIQGTLERNFRHVLGHEDFNILGASRTDSGVSCLNGAFELFLKENLELSTFIQAANENLPADIRLLDARPVSVNFNIIQDVVAKRYGYYFALGEKPHPFLSGALAYAGRDLDLELMKSGAALFEGIHDFRRFCTQGKQTDDFIRMISNAEISSLDTELDFWPKKNVYVFRINGQGFLMHQVRRMAAALFMLGKAEISLPDIESALISTELHPFCPSAPAQGLVLEGVTFKNLY
ncbi:tRNA pseudouridine(38-40) synthase TruA [Lunatibacter salilacus]|uniref:tRNA pseudouridine(38-40) synthase TruA n=1 Tax=Lunatibacter salilacus TaxID=2483804 RepID=UPI00131A8316|nr:tRNA pseudouridine(38-40) synthase TruA [Lunatibacter salilacus]